MRHSDSLSYVTYCVACVGHLWYAVETGRHCNALVSNVWVEKTSLKKISDVYFAVISSIKYRTNCHKTANIVIWCVSLCRLPRQTVSVRRKYSWLSFYPICENTPPVVSYFFFYLSVTLCIQSLPSCATLFKRPKYCWVAGNLIAAYGFAIETVYISWHFAPERCLTIGVWIYVPRKLKVGGLWFIHPTKQIFQTTTR